MEPTPDRKEKMATAAPKIASTPAYQLEEDEEAFIIRIPKRSVTRDRLSRLLDWIEVEHLKGGIDITQAEAAELAWEVKHAVWERLRPHVDAAIDPVANAGVSGLPGGEGDEMERLRFMSSVERALRQVDAGQFVSHEEAKRRFGR